MATLEHGEPCVCGTPVNDFWVKGPSIGAITDDYEITVDVQCPDCEREYQVAAFFGHIEEQ